MKITPLADVVIIERQTLEKVGSILIPIESENFREDIGTVVAVGPDAGLKTGDRVLFSTHGHQITKIDGKELIVLRKNSIIGVFHE